MPTHRADRDLVLGITPFHEPNADLVVAVERAGHLGVLDLGSDAAGARAAIDRIRQRLGGRPFGVRLGGLSPAEAVRMARPAEADTILLDAARWQGPWPEGPGRVLAEVTSPREAEEALRRGVHGLVARGFEAGGRVGELSTFVLLQRLAAAFPDIPVWAMGGIGLHTAAAAVAGGARGVVLDAQLALVTETHLPAPVRAAIAAMDGSETRVTGGYRVYTRPGLPSIEPAHGRFGARDLHAQLLPVGQDGAFAAPLAARYRTAGGVTRAVAAAVTAQLDLAARIEPLSGAVPVQGPMTRVSDRAEFAAAVAAGGGLPFFALALTSGDQVADLLGRTAAQLRTRPWGVGILGFAPPEVREAQLTAILAARPPYALIAGGRPAQAAQLQQAGIETFLHVPSPGLLDQFLASGARRFVFEGAECGGHTGPRGSFALWDAAVARLLAQPDLTGTQVWFAGGVHDDRSAAMVAAMAAPLADRGVRVSVLMGTAYLFTSEITSSGAVVPLYQRTARECEHTALLESSPGRVIRCADTPYVDSFGAAKERLIASGAGQQETWAELEQLSLGRLRVAAKGLRRDGNILVGVDEQEARGDGMFMLGQVATLRADITTVAALHEQVTEGATRFLAARAAACAAALDGKRDSAGLRPLDVAIVGMACVYPGAADLGGYWSNVVAGTDSVTGVPPTRWQPEQHPAVPSARGGFIGRLPLDPLAYGIPPAALASIEPVQLLALEVAARALADAGYSTRPFDRSRASVIFGAEPGSDLSAAYALRTALPGYLPEGTVPEEFDEFLPQLTEDSFPGVLGNVIAGRIANRLDLGGANYAVDAACASSLAALDLACKELTAGTSDLVLCGGADTHNGVHDYEMFASVQALSPAGRCATFDAQADGIVLGEGVGCVVLKRLADAERDGDRIYAVVKGVGASSDGRSLGLTAPRPEGQQLALERAYAMAGVSPADVGLVEAHGTGTVAGDRAELAILTAVFTDAGATPGGCTVGSVKSQIGHTKCAAGLAGLIKVACSLHTGSRPGTIHLTEPNAYWDPAASPFEFTAGRARPWPASPGQRHAGVSAFGFGGTNFHAVLSGYEGADEPAHGLRDWPAELFVLRGDAAESAAQLAALQAANDGAGRPWRLARLAATMATRPGPVRAAFVAASLDDLAAKLRDPLSGALLASAGAREQAGAVAFLFPGQGSQRPGMAADLLTAFPRLQRLLRLAGQENGTTMFPPAAFSKAERDRYTAAVTDTRVAQPALGVAGLVIWELLKMTGLRPDMAAGHSYGELVALCAAGAYDEASLLALSEIRASAMLASLGADPGAMASVSGDATRVAAVLRQPGLDGTGAVIANHNAPDQVVISGPTAAVEGALDALAAAGLSARRLGMPCAFHSPLVGGAVPLMATALAGRPVAAPRFPVYANSTAAPYPRDPQAVRQLLASQVADPVRFAEQIEAMYAAGARVFVEAGPGRTLTSLVGRVLGRRPHTAVACDVPGEHGLTRFLGALAGLVAVGVPVDPVPLFAGRAEPIPAGATPPRASWTVDGHLVRTADGEPVIGGLRPVTEAPRLALASEAGTTASVIAGPAESSVDRDRADRGGADRDRVVAEFLRTTRDLVAAQREVVLGYLGTGPQPAVGTIIEDQYQERMRLTIPAQSAAPPPFGPEMAGSVPGKPAQGGPVQVGPVQGSPAQGGTIQASTVGAGAASADAASGGGTPGGGTVWTGLAQGGSASIGPVSAGPASPSPAAPPSAADIAGAVVAVISGRTGYPPEMLGADLDLEADLSIDSIKRTEIIAALADRLGLATAGVGVDEQVMEELSGIKTISGIAGWLTSHLGSAAEASPAPAPTPIPAEAPADSVAATRPAMMMDRQPYSSTATDPLSSPAPGGEAGPTGVGAVSAGGGVTSAAIGPAPAGGAAARPRRLVVEPAFLPPASDGLTAPLRGRYLIVEDGRGVALELADLLEQRGAEALIAETPSASDLVQADALVHLGALRPGGRAVLPEAFGLIRDALAARVHTVLVATAGGGTFGAGPTGSGAGAGDGQPASGQRPAGPGGFPGGDAMGPGTGAVGPMGSAMGSGGGAVGPAGSAMGSGGGAMGPAGNGMGPVRRVPGSTLAGSGLPGTGPAGGNPMGGSAPGGIPAGGNPAGRDLAGRDLAGGDLAGRGAGWPGSADAADGPEGSRPTVSMPVLGGHGGHGAGADGPGTLLDWALGGRAAGPAGNWAGGNGAGGNGNWAARPGAGLSRVRAGLPEDEPCDLGLRGLIRTVGAEYPAVLARAVDVEPKDSSREIAAQLLAELARPGGPAVVGYRAGRRTGLRVTEAALTSAGLAAQEAPRVPLDAGSVVLLTGGARGITASVALGLARATGCHIELIGGTPPPGPADLELESADPVALRQLLIARGAGGPREVEAEAGRVLRERQVRATIAGLRTAAASVRYHSADVRDAAAVGAVLDDVYARFGRLDGVIHGAGVVEDRLIADKTPESFARVYGTKVDGAQALAAGLREPVRFFVLFGSVSGVFGNRGQADYAAANDALDALARHWSDDTRMNAGRLVSVDWGPWAGGGMVSPELEREYARRGVTLIDPGEGVGCLLAELAEPAGTAPAQVVYLCGEVPDHE